MSSWTHITGTIKVQPAGRTQPEKRYILDTVLSHLPKVTGSEGNMKTYVLQRAGHDSLSSHDEFGNRSNLAQGRFDTFEMQSRYIIVVDADLRDREFNATVREFSNWLCRLSKRVIVDDVLVEINDGFDRSTVIRNTNDCYSDMFESPTWSPDNTGEPAWYEYLMWDRARDYDMPILLAYKYINDAKNDEEAERRIEYHTQRGTYEL